MGDIVALVEKASETIDAEKAAKAAKRMRSGKFDLNDFSDQLRQMSKIGGMGGIMNMMPGVAKAKKQIVCHGPRPFHVPSPDGDHLVDDLKGAVQSPHCSRCSRKKRVAAGSGTEVGEISPAAQDAPGRRPDMMKEMGRGKGMFARIGGMMGL